ncbi:MAG: PKD domain-containing protein [Kiritimatiellae bacterium]|nr:PKD domain-containing protein [Kiritimatiellia bacterium]
MKMFNVTRHLGLWAGICLFAATVANAALVARWDFNNYDPANPTSANILKASVGGETLDGVPCYYVGKGTAPVTDGTLGQLYVVAADYPGRDAEVATAAAALGGGNYALAIPKSSHVKLPLPDSVKNHAFTLKVRFWSPAASSGKYRSFIAYPGNTADAKLFINKSNKIGGGTFFGGGSKNYSQEIVNSQWHTFAFSAGEQRWDLFLNETVEAGYANNGNGKGYFNYDHFLLCGDEDGEDELLYIDYVELYDDASAYGGKLPHYTKAGLTGEWTFPAGNALKATVGQDLVRHTRTGDANFAEGTDGILPGDGYLRAGQNNDLICYHGLPTDSSYTLVMDVRVPDNENSTKTWHGLLKTTRTGDGRVFIKYESNVLNIRTAGGKTVPMGVDFGEWARVVMTYNKGDKDAKVVYVNGVELDRRADGNMRPDKDGYFLLLGDEDGEDYDTDISYAAIYDRVLTPAEVAELHSRPLAQQADESFIPAIAPAGVWTADGTGTLITERGTDLTAGENGALVWTRSAAPASATWIADLTLPATQADGGVLVKNANNVASGIFGTDSTYSGSFHTTTDPTTFTGNSTLSTWGYWSEKTLDRTAAHRVAVTWAANGRVHYYVDGQPWGQLFPANANTAAKPTAVMSFFDGIGATVTRLAAYDAPLTGDEIAALGGAGSTPDTPAPTITFDANVTDGQARIQIDTVSFAVTTVQSDGEYVACAIDFGDGSSETPARFTEAGTQTFSHIYSTPGTYTVRASAISQNGVSSEMATYSITLVEPSNHLVWSGGDGNWADTAWKYCDDTGTPFEGTWAITWLDGHDAVIPSGTTVTVSDGDTPVPAELLIAANATLTFQIEAGTIMDDDVLMETTAGITMEGTVTATAGAVRVDDTGLKLLYVSDPTVPIITHWTGAAGNGALDDPGNWATTNIINQAIVAAPTEATTVYLDGNLNINIPEGVTLPCKACLVGDVTLTADCDWRGLGTLNLIDDARLNLNGFNLQVAGFDAETGAIITSAYACDPAAAAPGILNNACFWLDASDTGTIETDGDGNVLTWTSKDASHVVATAATEKPVYDTVTWGRPTIDFGAVSSLKDMTYPRFTGLKTVFWVIQIANAQNAFLLGDINDGGGVYNFHRGTSGQYGHSDHAKFASVWDGTNPVDWKSTTPSFSRFLVISAVMSQGCASDSLTNDRNLNNGQRTGGRQLSELICFDMELGDEERLAVTEYLQRKWMGDGTPSELHIDVPEGGEFRNDRVAINGNIRVVKDGKGIYSMGYTGTCTYDGGTYVAEGTVRPATTVNCHFGTRYSTIQVAKDAMFDLWSRYVNVYAIQLDGATLVNTYNPATGDANAQLWSISLTDDSRFVFSNMDKAHDVTVVGTSVWNLGGKTLTLVLDGYDPDFTIKSGAVISNGTLVVDVVREDKRGWLHNEGLIGKDGLTLDLGASPLRLKGNSSVYNFTTCSPHSDVTSNSGCLLDVYGTFTPDSIYGFNMRMMDGSTINLAKKTEAWSTTFANTACSLIFEENATVKVDVHERDDLAALAKSDNPYLITWTTAPADTVTFLPDEDTAKRGFKVRRDDTGVLLYYVGGTTIILR